MIPEPSMLLPHTCYGGNNTSRSPGFNSLLLKGDPCLTNISKSDFDLNDTAVVSSLLRDFKKSLYLLHEPRIIVLLCMYALVFILSIVGNSLVIIVISGQKGQKSSISLFLLTMAIADLLVAAICVPTNMAQAVYRGWLLGGALCKMPVYVQGVAVISNIYTVVLMSMDRFLSIRYPTLLKKMNGASYTRITVAIIWIFAGLFMIPMLTVRTTEVVDILPTEPVYFCVEHWSSFNKRLTFSIATLLCVYIVPCTAMVGLYTVLGKELWASEDRMMTRRESTISVTSSRAVIGRKRVARTAIFVAAVLIVCWMPYHIFSTIVEIKYRRTDNDTLAGFHFAMWLGHANCAIKPVLYCFMGSTFRRKMIKLVMKCSPVCKRQVFTVAYQMDPTNFQWTLADYGLAAGASPRPSFASWNTSLPSPLSCYSLHWPLSENQTPRASISTQSRSYQHSPRSSVGFLSPPDDYSPRGSFSTDGREHVGATMCFLDTPPFLSPRASLSIDRRGSSVSQQRTPRPSISVDPSGRSVRSPRISVSFEDHEASLRSPRGSFCMDEKSILRSSRPSIYCDERPMIRSPRHSFCTEEPIVIQSPRQSFCTEEKPIFLTTKPYYYYPDDRRVSRRATMCAENNPCFLSPRRSMYTEDKHSTPRRQSMSTSTGDFHGNSRTPTVPVTSPGPVNSTDLSDAFTSPDHENKGKRTVKARHIDESEDDYSPNEMITYSNSRRQSLASNASRRSAKPSSPRSDKSEAKHLRTLKRQQVAAESNRSRRSSVATVADSVENKSRRGSVITLGDLQENRSRRSSVNTLGDNLENRSRRSSVITLGDALETMMRQGSRNTLAESPGNRSQKSSPRSHTPSLRGSPHNQVELESIRNRPTPSVETARRASIATMGDSVDSTSGIREKRRASCSDFSETTHDSKERTQSALHQQHSFPFGKQEEKHRRPSCAAVEVVDQFLTTRRSSTQISQNGLDDNVDKRSGSRSRSRSPSPNVQRKDSIPISRTSPRMSPQQIQEDESDNEHFRPINDIPDSTSRVIEWKKGLDKERQGNDLSERKMKKKPRSPTEQHRNVKEKRNTSDKTWRLGRSAHDQVENENIPIYEYPSSGSKSGKRRASCSTESEKSKTSRKSSVYRNTFQRSNTIDSSRNDKTKDIYHTSTSRTDYHDDDQSWNQHSMTNDLNRRPKTRRASIHTDERRHFEQQQQPYYVVDDGHGYHCVEQPIYFSGPDPQVEYMCQKTLPRQAMSFRDTRRDDIINEPELGRRHSYVGLPPYYEEPRKPVYYVEPPTMASKRRASLAFWSSHDHEEMIHVTNDHRTHPALRQKRASLPVIEGLPTIYYPNIKPPIESRETTPNRSMHVGFGNRVGLVQGSDRKEPSVDRPVHIGYSGNRVPLNTGQRSPRSRGKYQKSQENNMSYDDPRARGRSRSVSWQCDDVDEEDEEEIDATTSLLKDNYLEIAT